MQKIIWASDLSEDPRVELRQEVEDMVGHQYKHPLFLGESPSYHICMNLGKSKDKTEGVNQSKNLLKYQELFMIYWHY